MSSTQEFAPIDSQPQAGGVEPKRTGPLRLALLGTRGIPARYGGFETFAERVAPLLVQRHGLEVTVIGDSSMESSGGQVGQVHTKRSRFNKSKNPLRFYWESLKLARDCADVALVCGTPGGGLGFRAGRAVRVLTNPDGLESRRGKWPLLVRWLFVASEKAATFFSDALVCDSKAIESYYKERHRAKHTFVAEYGALPNPFLGEGTDQLAPALAKEGLVPGGYHLVVARLEPENSIQMIVEAYAARRQELRLPLLILSNQPDSDYARRLTASPPEGVRFLGSIFERERLDALRAGACTYLHGHTVGGTNPSLVEAMASGNLCLCRDNQFNRATTAGQALFFEDAEQLGQQLVAAEARPSEHETLRQAALERWAAEFTWEQISDKYARLLDIVSERGSAGR